jgi:hypothetical protein
VPLKLAFTERDNRPHQQPRKRSSVLRRGSFRVPEAHSSDPCLRPGHAQTRCECTAPAPQERAKSKERAALLTNQAATAPVCRGGAWAPQWSRRHMPKMASTSERSKRSCAAGRSARSQRTKDRRMRPRKRTVWRPLDAPAAAAVWQSHSRRTARRRARGAGWTVSSGSMHSPLAVSTASMSQVSAHSCPRAST